MESTFFAPGSRTREGHLASLHLNRDQELAVKLSTVASRAEDQGYAEGVVTNTKFGSFPHTTLIDVPWGCQVLASKVDTGTRGRAKFTHNKKRKISAISTDASPDGDSSELKQATVAASGFIHVLPPTPESWTTSLPHRTQVVYTPDYSYILQRIRARPGSTLVEAGSGSGSFTHAAIRAVFQGSLEKRDTITSSDEIETSGKVFTFEYHAERQQKVAAEMKDHDLDSVVVSTHRDVYKDGFWIKSKDGRLLSPKANCIFLDLPAPWEALSHLTRDGTTEKPSALDSTSTVHICTFSPCIEQAQKTISFMRRLGWQEIEMVEIQHKRIDVRREYTGLEYEGMRSVNAVAVSVDEALARLKDVEEKSREHQAESNTKQLKGVKTTQQNRQLDASKIHWNQGRLVHRSEPELKTHTSYLVFAILPQAWTDDEEAQAIAAAPNPQGSTLNLAKSQKQMRREAKQRKNSTTQRQQQSAETKNESSP